MGKVCESCGTTRWERRQVDGWIEAERAEVAALKLEIRRLQAWMAWACFEIDDAADAIGPVPDLAEKCLRSVEKRLNGAINDEHAKAPIA